MLPAGYPRAHPGQGPASTGPPPVTDPLLARRPLSGALSCALPRGDLAPIRAEEKQLSAPRQGGSRKPEMEAAAKQRHFFEGGAGKTPEDAAKKTEAAAAPGAEAAPVSSALDSCWSPAEDRWLGCWAAGLLGYWAAESV